MCNRSFAHCLLHTKSMEVLKLSHFINFKRYALHSETSKFRGCRIAMHMSNLVKTITISCGKLLYDVSWDNWAQSLIQDTVCLKEVGKEVEGKWTVQNHTHFPLLCFLETLLYKILLGTTLVIYSERGKYFVTIYKRQ